MSALKKSSKAFKRTTRRSAQPSAQGKPVLTWLPKPEAHDYPAAASYLALLVDEKLAARLARKLKRAPMTSFKAKDIFRASALSLLGVSNSHVRKNLLKIDAGEALSPLLLVRDTDNGKVVVADGYHRLCSVYALDEDAVIPCKIV
jgi:disulfide oxidoreductase YuzD